MKRYVTAVLDCLRRPLSVIITVALLGIVTQAFAQIPVPLRIQCPTNRVAFSCAASIVRVTYPNPIVTGGDCRTGPIVTCSPPSGAFFPVGTNTVTCTATNECGERDSCTFTIAVVRDVTPPKITCPSNIIMRACSSTGTQVNYPPPAVTDEEDPNPDVDCTPAPGSFFPIGTTVVTCVATDACTNRAACTFTVTVQIDTTPPTIRCPDDILVRKCGPGGAVVNYPAPVVMDNTDPNPSVACNPASGSVFPEGVTIVTCVATDACTNRATCTFTVRVVADTTPPVIHCPSNIVVQTCNTNLAVNYPPPTAVDDHDPAPMIICQPPSGSVFPMGITMVQCSAIDNCTNRSFCNFTVTVNTDRTPPVIECPTNIVVWTCDTNAVPVTYPAPTAMDDQSLNVTVNCIPPSGSLFPLGTTIVTCTAEDDCGNESTCRFTITVRVDTVPPTIDCPDNRFAVACNSNGTAVAFLPPEVFDAGDPTPTVVCVPPSGSVFPLGVTTVRCTAQDDCNNRSLCEFTVTVVQDTIPPVIQCQSNIVVSTCFPEGKGVPYMKATATDDHDIHPAVTCQPPMGWFPIGITVVTCTAEDNCGNRSSCMFTVTVRADAEFPGIDLDGNGLSDVWQIRFDASNLAPGEDTDGDGQINSAEARAGTDPRDPRSRFQVMSVLPHFSRGEVELRWSGVEGKSYQVQVTTDLGGVWYNVGSPQAGLPVMMLVFALNDPTLPPGVGSQSFFRVLVTDVDVDGDHLTAWEESIIGTSDLTPNTHGDRGGDHDAAQNWLSQNDTSGIARLRETTLAHIGGSPQGPTPARLVTATGTGAWIKLSSWGINPAPIEPVHLQDTAPIEGHHAKLHVLEPPLSPSLTINLFVHGRIRADGNLWLQVFRLEPNGTFVELSTLGFGENVALDVKDFAIAHRPLLNPNGTVDRFQLVTPVVAMDAMNEPQVRVLAWTVHPNTGALTAVYDTGDLGHVSEPRDGGFVQIRHLTGSSYVVSYSTQGNFLSSWFFEVTGANVVLQRGGQTSGLNIRGTEDLSVAAGQLALAPLSPDGFLTAVVGTNCALDLLVWERRIVACDGPCFSRPFLITSSSEDKNPANHGVLLDPPVVTDSRADLAEANDRYGNALAIGDFNGDGYQDVAIGVPGENDSAGVVDIMYGSANGLTGGSKDQSWSQDSDNVFGAAEPNDLFGAALAAGDFNNDGFDDLAIGIPGENLDNTPQMVAAGAVQILRGSANGLTASGNNLFWSQDTTDVLGEAEGGDNFGTTLATGDFNNDNYIDLAIGSPFEDVGAIQGAGAVNVIYGSAAGLSATAGPGNLILHQDIASVTDQAETSDWFGASLATGDFDGNGFDDLAVGVPLETVNGVDETGVVQVFYGQANGFSATDQFVNQTELLPGGAGILGIAETSDHFGHKLAAGDFNGDGRDDLAIGAPSEDLDNEGIDTAGAVNVLYGSDAGLTAAGNQLFTQDGISPGNSDLEGVAEQGDSFGRALTVGDFNDDGFDDLVVGAPWENVGDIVDAGAIHVVLGSANGLTGAGDKVFWQGNDSVQNQAESYDEFGRAMAAGDLNGDGKADLVVGAPDEDRNDEDEDEEFDIGLIHVLYSDDNGLTGTGDQVWTQGDERKIRVMLSDVQWEQAYGEGDGALFEKMPLGEPISNHVASVTKIMTLLLAVEALQDPGSGIALTDDVEISQLAGETGGSKMGPPLLEEGDVMPLGLLLHGMMLRSCNRASVAIGEHVAGNFDDFVAAMNEKAQQLGMQNTIYTHPAGGCVTTPQDQITLWIYAWQHPLFRQISSEKIYSDCGVDSEGEDKCYFLTKHSDNGYPGLEGWKGGNGRLGPSLGLPSCTSCLVAQATRLARALVVSHAQSGDRWGDADRLFDFGYKLLFTPDWRGGGLLNTPNVTDFAVRRVHDTLAVTALVDAQNVLRVHTWQVVAGIGQVGPLGNATLTYNNLVAGPKISPSTLLDITTLPTVGEAEADYITGHLENGRLRLDVWRVGAEPGQ